MPIDGFVQELQRMMKAMRGSAPYVNEGMVIAEGTMTCIMAREAAYAGLEITWDTGDARRRRWWAFY